MLMAAEAQFTFFQFVWYAGKPSIFWAVQAGALAGLAHLWFVFRKSHGRVELERTAKLLGLVPTLSLVGLIAGLAVATQVEHGIGWGAPLSCAFFALVSFGWFVARVAGRAAPDEDIDTALDTHTLPSITSYLRGLDWRTTLFVMAVFVPVSALAHYGWVDKLAHMILAVSGGSAVVSFIFLAGTAMIVSGFVDNIPFLLVMLPAVTVLGSGLGIEGKPVFLYFGLLLGTSVGGNITPIGAQANIAAVGLLRKHGHPMSLREYVSLSLPYTIVAVAASCLFTYLVYGPS
jgi:Na+/H+ antiporter NhaD/arsenite permease-like protein